MSDWKQENFFISTDKEKLDTDVIFTFLSNSYWASTCASGDGGMTSSI